MVNKITGIVIALIGAAMLYMGGKLLLLGEPVLRDHGGRSVGDCRHADDEQENCLNGVRRAAVGHAVLDDL